jgi:hypothetical protein
MKPTALRAAETVMLRSLMEAHPATLTIGTTTVRGAMVPRRGARMEFTGGLVQKRMMGVIIPFDAVAPALLIDATTGATRTHAITHVETGLAYKMEPDGVQLSPQRAYYILHASQTVTP